MTASSEDYRAALDRAHAHTSEWLESLDTRPVAPRQTADQVAEHFGIALQTEGIDPAEVVDELATFAEPGLMGIPSGRFYGWVMGGTLPAALASDWLVSAWDQNTGIRFATPASAAIEEAAETWLLDLLGLPAESGVGFTTGATMANFVGLAAGRKKVLDAVGWNVDEDGLSGAPRITVLAGAESHASIDMALRYLGLGLRSPVAADEQGRIRVDALREALDASSGPTILCLQAGNLHSGSFDPFREAIELAHAHGAWVHVDGAFGLWAAASPAWASAVDGLSLADSWATDAHKTLNVPYDCGVAIVADRALMRSSFGVHTDYLIHDAQGDPFERVPEFSRRARGIPVWAALRSLGRSGTIALVERLAANARALADALGALPGVEILNDVVFTQVCLSFGTDERTRAVTEALIRDGAVWMSGSRWRDRAILRISVSNWSTDAEDVAESIQAVRRAMAAAG
ncbi:aspartate aminotransferase family protein [Mycetocola manganoxydans]|uniref:Aspartate aminotransferase family protein n=1 Tax=Mycetocola manganoxydans TaxID=699879 RepID=A0A3L7A191_9MICO|nr:aminotransferase class V-fold PLP-dependent enzyme [Mycetocola manganoxydans]RLP73735.1 aspartate aminotransferase family protein [Mycetocola manganoxydans]GHD43318.1 aspartate aminotransferase family protein [Mycetocola manganoxydans]